MKYDDEFDDEFDILDGESGDDEDEFDDESDLPRASDSGSPVDISMEVDPNGNEVWYAADSRIPGSTSIGNSIEEVMDGVDERRRQYREMLRRSREKSGETE